MFGHVAERQHPSRSLILSFLLAVAFGWSFAVSVVREESPVAILRGASAVAVTLAVLRLGLMLMAFKRRRRGRKGDETDAEGQPSADGSTEDARPTYGDIFGTSQDLDGAVEPGGSFGGEPEGEPDGEPETEPDEAVGSAEWVDGELEATVEQSESFDGESEGETVEAVGSAEWVEGELEGTVEQSESIDAQLEGTVEHSESYDGDLDGTNDEVESIQADLEAQEALRRVREEFKARAKEAELRVRQREAELDEAHTGQTSP
jgi:hypothetical protein